MITRKRIHYFEIVLFFCSTSIFFVFPLYRTHTILNGGDMTYHIIRIQELIANFKQGNWLPFLYTHFYHKTAYASSIFYPQYTLYPMAIIGVITRSVVTGFYFGIVFYTFLTQLIMYYIMRHLNRSILLSCFISFSYAFSTYRTINGYSRTALGEFIAMTFIPLALYGMYSLMKRNRSGWLILSIGFSLIMLTHIISTVLTVVFLLIIFLILIYNDHNKFGVIMIDIIKAIGFTLMLSAIFWVPFLEQELSNHFDQPAVTRLSESSLGLGNFLIESANNTMSVYQIRGNSWWDLINIGTLMVISIFWAIFNWKKLDRISRYGLTIGIITALLSTSLFPWDLLQRTPISVIQFPFRLLIFGTIFLCPVEGDMFKSILGRFSNRNIATILCMLAILLSWYSGIKTIINDYSSMEDNYHDGKIYNSNKVESAYWSLDQYISKSSKDNVSRIFYHQAIVNRDLITIKNIDSIPNGLILYSQKLNDKSNVVLPVSSYKNVEVIQNNTNLKISDYKGRIMVHNTKRGPLKVIYVPSQFDKLAVIIFMFGWVATLIVMSYKKLCFFWGEESSVKE